MTDRATELRQMAEAATPGPWLYRPMPHDDWGVVRAPHVAEWGGHPFLCQAYDPAKRDDPTLMAHREAKTDPWEANARLIAQAPTIALELADALDLLAKKDEELARVRRLVKRVYAADLGDLSPLKYNRLMAEMEREIAALTPDPEGEKG